MVAQAGSAQRAMTCEHSGVLAEECFFFFLYASFSCVSSSLTEAGFHHFVRCCENQKIKQKATTYFHRPHEHRGCPSSQLNSILTPVYIRLASVTTLRSFFLAAAAPPVAGNGLSPPAAGNQRHASGGVSSRSGGGAGGADVPGLGDAGGIGMRRIGSSGSSGSRGSGDSGGGGSGGGASGGTNGGDDVKPLLVRYTPTAFACFFCFVFVFFCCFLFVFGGGLAWLGACVVCLFVCLFTYAEGSLSELIVVCLFTRGGVWVSVVSR